MSDFVVLTSDEARVLASILVHFDLQFSTFEEQSAWQTGVQKLCDAGSVSRSVNKPQTTALRAMTGEIPATWNL